MKACYSQRCKSLTALSLFFCLFATSIACLAHIRRAAAQSTPDGWTQPLNLFETTGRASEAEVVADIFGDVHVFWAYGAPENEEIGAGQAIYYASKHLGVWSKPVDILVSPSGRIARMPSIASDEEGYLHIVWSGGNALYYSRAFAPQANSAHSWSYPYALVTEVAVLEPSIAAGKGGELYVVWSQSGTGLMFAQSQDGGETWSTPEAIFLAERDNELIRWGRIAVDERGGLHVALTHTELNPGSTEGRVDPNYLYYLHSSDHGVTWSEPMLVADDPDFGEVNVATFAPDTVHLVWNGRAGRNGRYHRYSEDGGANWSVASDVLSPQAPAGSGGLTGFPAVVADATGALHMVSATDSGDFYFKWKDGVWSPPVLVSVGLSGSGVTHQASSLEQPAVALSEGNQLHVVFHDGFERIWYVASHIDAPTQQKLDFSVVPLTPAPMMNMSATQSPAIPTLAQVRRIPKLTKTPEPQVQASTYLLLGITPSILVVGGVLIVVRARQRRR